MFVLLRDFGYLKKLKPHSYDGRNYSVMEAVLFQNTKRFCPIWFNQTRTRERRSFELVFEDAVYRFDFGIDPADPTNVMQCQMVDIVNHILERRNESRRLVNLRQSGGGYTVFGSRQMLFELQEQFDFEWERGCENYLQQ